MNTILDPIFKCNCIDCLKDTHFHPNYCRILQPLLPTDPEERCRFMQKLYFLKPFSCNSWTKDWKSVTHRDFVFREDLWSIDFPKPALDMRPGFSEFVCKKWCKETHNEPLPANAARTMPNFFEEPRRAIYSDLRQCCSTYAHDFTWRDDYREKDRFPGWCLRGSPPQYLDQDRTP